MKLWTVTRVAYHSSVLWWDCEKNWNFIYFSLKMNSGILHKNWYMITHYPMGHKNYYREPKMRCASYALYWRRKLRFVKTIPPLCLPASCVKSWHESDWTCQRRNILTSINIIRLSNIWNMTSSKPIRQNTSREKKEGHLNEYQIPIELLNVSEDVSEIFGLIFTVP